MKTPVTTAVLQSPQAFLISKKSILNPRNAIALRGFCFGLQFTLRSQI
jgi:hypothetical protein